MPDDFNRPSSIQLERWQELAEKASQEQNPDKLLHLVRDLCEELEKREAALRKRLSLKP